MTGLGGRLRLKQLVITTHLVSKSTMERCCVSLAIPKESAGYCHTHAEAESHIHASESRNEVRRESSSPHLSGLNKVGQAFSMTLPPRPEVHQVNPRPQGLKDPTRLTLGVAELATTLRI